jgi:hypothetical protein
LVADAERRDKQLRDSVISKQINEVNAPRHVPVDKNSTQLIFKRFERDLSQVYSHYELTNESMIKEDKAFEIMVQMGFTIEGNQGDKDLWQAIWSD